MPMSHVRQAAKSGTPSVGIRQPAPATGSDWSGRGPSEPRGARDGSAQPRATADVLARRSRLDFVREQLKRLRDLVIHEVFPGPLD